MNDSKCLEKLRAMAPEAHVVLVSGFAEKEIRPRFEGVTIQGAPPKPLPPNQLKDILTMTLYT